MELETQKQLSLTLEGLLTLVIDKTYLEGIIPKLTGLARYKAEMDLRVVERVLSYEYEQAEKERVI